MRLIPGTRLEVVRCTLCRTEQILNGRCCLRCGGMVTEYWPTTTSKERTMGDDEVTSDDILQEMVRVAEPLDPDIEERLRALFPSLGEEDADG